ncbi:MAG TPA: gamma-glutamylcyclotransferase family protein [Microbacterium sp.]|uniref:gamma-glutamylcyclotransferase family protein n=1 Tax=Microbacterium sp. TaxID=51671 RepID=UPI002C0AB858|nr:gamma-glutamylcyclotransferase family protein [Microbacterium sp.]HWI30636.1 gamma-glutamylcyclotransferase family protein [Microbacterium sp.]
MSDAPANEILFTYGTLRLPQVQLDTFGRVIDGDDDVLPGYTVDYVDIEDPHVVELSGHVAHPIVRHTGNALDKVVGTALLITEDELDAADEYEVELYHRERVRLASDRDAWVYVAH